MILVKNFKFLPSLFVFERGFNMTLDDVVARKKMLFYHSKNTFKVRLNLKRTKMMFHDWG